MEKILGGKISLYVAGCIIAATILYLLFHIFLAWSKMGGM